MRSIIIAMSTMTTPASRLWPNAALRMVLTTSQPMSAELPMRAAMITMLSPAITVWLTPIRTVGSAVGTCTHHRSWRRVAPHITPDSTTSLGTRCRPRITPRTIGGVA